jgi:type VI secretion system protein VasD
MTSPSPARTSFLSTGALVALVLMGTALAGCGSVRTYVRGVSPLNTNDNNESTPVDVRFFQLASDAGFQKATFDELWIDPAKALGGDLLGKMVVITVPPGKHEDQAIRVDLGAKEGKAKFIGAMALYRKTDASEQRTLIIPIDQAEKLVVEVTGYRIQLSSDGVTAPSGKAASHENSPANQPASAGTAPASGKGN